MRGPVFSAEELRAAGLVAIVDCRMCGGSGVMAARKVDREVDPDATVIACPACQGASAHLEPAGARS